MTNSLQAPNNSRVSLSSTDETERPSRKRRQPSRYQDGVKEHATQKIVGLSNIKPPIPKTSKTEIKKPVSVDPPVIAKEVKQAVVRIKLLPVGTPAPKPPEVECAELVSITHPFETAKRYVPHVLIGEGTFGKVYQGFSDRGSPIAIKEHADQKDRYSLAVSESVILTEIDRLQVPHRLHLRDVYEKLDPVQRGAFHRTIVTDFIPTQNVQRNHLSDYGLSTLLSENDFITIARQYLEFLAHLSKAHIIHGDLNPMNSVFELGCRHLTVLDYGMAHKVGARFLDVFQTSYYRAPEVILKGAIDCSVDTWSLACILFELYTGLPLFPVFDHPIDLKISSNTLLQKMDLQIGMPYYDFLKNCRDASLYYKWGATSLEFVNPEPSFPPFPWKAAIKYASYKRGVSDDTTNEIIELLDKMLRYEKRASPDELLTSSLFQRDISFHLSDEFSPQDVIEIYSFTEVMFQTANGGIFPKPIFELDKKQLITRNCFHIPRDPQDQYFVSVIRPGAIYLPQICELKEGETLSFKFVENVVPVTPLVETSEDPFPPMPPELSEASPFSSEPVSDEWSLFGDIIREANVIGSDSFEPVEL